MAEVKTWNLNMNETLEEEKHVFFENYIVFRFHAMLSF